MPTDNLDALRAREGYPPADDTLRVEGATKRAKKSAIAGQLGATTAGYDADESDAVAGDSLAALQGMAQELLDCEAEIRGLMADVKAAMLRLEDVQEKRLPDLMERHSLPKFTFFDKSTGTERTIKLETGKWSVRMPPIKDEDGNYLPENEKKRKRIFEWFRSIGKGGIIKKNVEVPAGLMPDAQVTELMTLIKEAYPTLDPGLSEKIEPATLTAQVRRLKDAGEAVTEDLICLPVRKAVVKNK